MAAWFNAHFNDVAVVALTARHGDKSQCAYSQVYMRYRSPKDRGRLGRLAEWHWHLPVGPVGPVSR